MKDGNYLAVNEKLEVYSLVHDAKPMVKKQNTSFDEILSDLQTNKFDKQQHLKDRYWNEDSVVISQNDDMNQNIEEKGILYWS